MNGGGGISARTINVTIENETIDYINIRIEIQKEKKSRNLTIDWDIYQKQNKIKNIW